MAHYHQVPNVTDVGVMTDAVRWIQDKVWVDRLEATIESHTLAAAQVRENCTIPGTSVRTAWLCRDKPSMKEVLRAAGVPTAASTAASTADEVRAFARRGRLPADPQAADRRRRAGHHPGRRRRRARRRAGPVRRPAASTRSPSRSSSRGTRASTTRSRSTASPALDFVSHYFPNVLEAMRTRWISPQFVATNRIDSVADYQELRDMGRRVNEALGIGTSATHMEWFFGPKGLKFSEIGCRPPGVGAWDLYSAGQRPRHLPRSGPTRSSTGRSGDTPVAAVLGRHRRAAARAGRHHLRVLGRRRDPGPARAVGARRAPAAARDADPAGRRPGTWPTRTSACGTPTSTRCAGCSTTSGAPCTSTRTDAAAVTPSITLLGPQRRPTLDRVLSSLDVGGPVAVVNAGWQERESDDAEILALAGGRAVNLRLFARWMDVLQADPEYAAAEREHRLVLDELQQLYLIRLDHALQAAAAVTARTDGHAHTLAMASADALEAVRLLDATHLARVA